VLVFVSGGSQRTSELWRLSAIALAHCIAREEVSPAEVIDADLARIDAVDPAVNAVVMRVLGDQARALARQSDRRLVAGERLGVLHGRTAHGKENIDWRPRLLTTSRMTSFVRATAPHRSRSAPDCADAAG